MSLEGNLGWTTSKYFSQVQTHTLRFCWFAYSCKLGVCVRKMGSLGTNFVEEKRNRVAIVILTWSPPRDIKTVTVRKQEQEQDEKPPTTSHRNSTIESWIFGLTGLSPVIFF